MKGLADDGKTSIGSGVVALVGVSDDGKASAVVAVTPDLVQRMSVLLPDTVGHGNQRRVRPLVPGVEDFVDKMRSVHFHFMDHGRALRAEGPEPLFPCHRHFPLQ